MTFYKIFMFGHQGGLEMASDMECSGDAAVLGQVRAMRAGRRVEIWDGDRMVASLNQRGEIVQPDYQAPMKTDF
ncbi:hypothetical protein KHC28_06910 [Ancylobacter sonchi]|uniref:hypothetical protein n=1 Tax=Ancylobacter sonchi TaxID=1937790 RepID=UPI001BD47D54|nr:hypothetical protein [Ancylobacter sonchi]MBS7533382.1 hypothetical protein [Ancylobacter sonchi]